MIVDFLIKSQLVSSSDILPHSNIINYRKSRTRAPRYQPMKTIGQFTAPWRGNEAAEYRQGVKKQITL